MQIHHIDHFTLCVAPQALHGLRDFYVGVLGLREGARPDFPFPGPWLSAGGHAVVHLAGNASPGEAAGAPGALHTGKLNHVALRASGLRRMREHLAQLGIEWGEAPVPGAPLHQIFLRDPVGLKIELTFDAAEREEAGPAAASGH